MISNSYVSSNTLSAFNTYKATEALINKTQEEMGLTGWLFDKTEAEVEMMNFFNTQLHEAKMAVIESIYGPRNEWVVKVWKIENNRGNDVEYVMGFDKETLCNYLDDVSYVCQPDWSEDVAFEGKVSDIPQHIIDDCYELFAIWIGEDEDGDDAMFSTSNLGATVMHENASLVWKVMGLAPEMH